jgi:hypothetical protein
MRNAQYMDSVGAGLARLKSVTGSLGTVSAALPPPDQPLDEEDHFVTSPE